MSHSTDVPPDDYSEQQAAEDAREIEVGLQDGSYRMINTRLLLEREVVDPYHRQLALSISELEQRHGPRYVLADGRMIEELSSTERANLVEFEVEQPTKVVPDHDDEG